MKHELSAKPVIMRESWEGHFKECFLNLACVGEWERPLKEDSLLHVFTGKVVHTAIDAERDGKKRYSRYKYRF
jgi:hypothetical protein